MVPALRILSTLCLLVLCCLSAGCNNDCQALCEEMANYWQDCNLNFGEAEVSECKDSFTSTSTEEGGNAQYDTYRSACRQLSRNSPDAAS